MNKQMTAAVAFARFVQRESLDIEQAATLIDLANRYFNLAERSLTVEIVGDDRRIDRATQKLETHAGKMGLSVKYPGLYPAFFRDGYQVHLPNMGK